MQTETEPRYVHDCDQCVFLGQSEGADLYFCKQLGARGDATVIARFSDDGPDYTSGLNSQAPYLIEAQTRAKIAGLIR